MTKQLKTVAAVESAAIQFGSSEALAACAAARTTSLPRTTRDRAHLTVAWYAARWSVG